MRRMNAFHTSCGADEAKFREMEARCAAMRGLTVELSRGLGGAKRRQDHRLQRNVRPGGHGSGGCKVDTHNADSESEPNKSKVPNLADRLAQRRSPPIVTKLESATYLVAKEQCSARR